MNRLIRAGMVDHPAEYQWSSYRVNGQGVPDQLLAEHDDYRRLGPTQGLRRAAYRAVFRAHMEPELVHEIRSATNGNYALGNDRFQKDVARMLGRRAARGQAGRSAKA